MYLPEKSFPILPPPSSLLWLKLSNGVMGLSFIIALACVFIIVRYGYVSGSVVVLILGLLLTLFFFILPFAIRYFRQKKPISARFPAIGYLHLGSDTIRISLLDPPEEVKVPFDQLGRLDVFYSRGISAQLNKDADPFETIQSMRISILNKDKRRFMLCVLNFQQDAEVVGTLYAELKDIKQLHKNLYQRIQFWDQF